MKTPIVKVRYEMYGHGDLPQTRVYTCKDYEILIRAANLNRDIQVIVNTPEGDSDEEALGELIAAIVKDQRNGRS